MKHALTENRVLPHRRDEDSPTKFHHAFKANAEYRMHFADHLHRAFSTAARLPSIPVFLTGIPSIRSEIDPPLSGCV